MEAHFYLTVFSAAFPLRLSKPGLPRSANSFLISSPRPDWFENGLHAEEINPLTPAGKLEEVKNSSPR